MTGEKSALQSSDIMSDFRGVWTPPVPIIVVALLIIGIGTGGYYVSISSVDPFDTERQLLVESNTTFVMEGESVRITVRDVNTDTPVDGAKITVEGTKTTLDSAPVLKTDERGQATFDFGRKSGDVIVDWPSGNDRVTVELVVITAHNSTEENPPTAPVTVIRP